MIRPFLAVSLSSLIAAAPAFAGVGESRVPTVQEVTGVRMSYSPQEMQASYDEAARDLEASIDRIVAIPAERRTFNNTVAALEHAKNGAFQEALGPLDALADVSPDAAVRDKALELREAASKLMIRLSSREDLYRALKEVADQRRRLVGPDRRLLAAKLKSFRLAGFEKKDGTPTTAEELASAVDIQNRLSELANAFGKNIADYKGGLVLSPERLRAAGLSEEFIAGLRPAENGADKRVSLDYPDYTGFMLQSTDAELRGKLAFEHSNQTFDPATGSAKNTPILREALELRGRLASLLGYANFAEYALQYNLIDAPEKAWTFLNTVRDALKDKAKALYAELLAFKKQHEPGATELHQWDVNLVSGVLGYWANRYIKERLGYDAEAMSRYFTVESTVKGTLAIYSKLFGVEFRRVPVRGTWHDEEVELYEVRDAKTGDVVAHLALDLFPREGKFKHFAAGEIAKGRVLEDGSYRSPVVFMMGNFNRPKDGKSANIAMELVNTFFHEFGHNMHQALTEARWPSQSGSSVSMDFVEAPSQMLENWVESYETLSLLSDPANPLPRELFDKMMAAKSFTEILVNIRQVALAALDLTYHTMTPPPADTTAVVNKVFEEVGFLPEAAGTHFEAGFGHLMGGYEGTYSGYLSSKVLAQEFFTVFRRDGMLAPAPGRAYRSTVLAHGGSVDARDLTRWFLGREPDPKMKAFLESIGAL